MLTSQSPSTTEPAATALVDLSLLWRRKWLLAASTLLFIAAGGAYVWTSDPMHQVGARVLVEKQGAPLQQPRAADHDKDFLPTQAEIIRSPAVIRRVVETLSPDVSDATPAIASILERLDVDPLMGTSVLSVRFLDEDAGRGIVTVEAILAAYREYLRDHEREAHRETLDLLTRREKELRRDVNSLHARYQELHQESPLVGQGRDSAGVQKAILTDMGKTLAAARNRRLELENHIQSLAEAEADADALADNSGEGIWLVGATLEESSTPTSFASVNTPTRARLLDRQWKQTLDVLSGMSKAGWIGVEDPAPLRDAYLAARERELELSALYGPRHPEIRAIRPQVAELEARLEEVIESAPAVLQRQRQAVLLQEETLREVYEREYAEAKAADVYALREAQIREELEKVQALHDSILSEIRQWELIDQAAADGRLGVSVRSLDEPAVTEHPLAASPKLVLAMCGLFGMLGGVFLVTAIERPKQASSKTAA